MKTAMILVVIVVAAGVVAGSMINMVIAAAGR